MQWRNFVGGLVSGLLIGAGGMRVAWKLDNQIASGPERPWALPDLEYQEFPYNNAQTIYVTGTLIGKGVGYPVNTWKMGCYKDEGICRIASVEEIGRDQLGSIDVNDWPIITWSDHTVVAQSDPSDTTSCAKSTITVNRDAKSVTYTMIPKNQDASYCKFLHDSKTYEWHIGTARKPWEKKSTSDDR